MIREVRNRVGFKGIAPPPCSPGCSSALSPGQCLGLSHTQSHGLCGVPYPGFSPGLIPRLSPALSRGLRGGQGRGLSGGLSGGLSRGLIPGLCTGLWGPTANPRPPPVADRQPACEVRKLACVSWCRRFASDADRLPKQASGDQSGSKLPHSKARTRVQVGNTASEAILPFSSHGLRAWLGFRSQGLGLRSLASGAARDASGVTLLTYESGLLTSPLRRRLVPFRVGLDEPKVALSRAIRISAARNDVPSIRRLLN